MKEFLITEILHLRKSGIFERGLNRVTDTCILKKKLSEDCRNISLKSGKMQKIKEKDISHTNMYKMILSGVLEQYYEIPRENSWMIAAAEKNFQL
jgi:deoxyhypusine synthase